MKKPGSDKSSGKKKAASPKQNRLEEKRLEKYKKQSLNTSDEEDEEDFVDELPEDANLDFPIDDFDDFDDEEEDDF